MSPPRSYREQVRGKLLDLWQRHEEYGEPVGCLSTTYTFDAAFYEEQCLGRFVGLESDPDENGRQYIIEREERLAEVFAMVFADRGRLPRQRSLRWHVLPVFVSGGGILHAKVHLLVWRKLIRVLIGSANLTEPGYRRNFEQVGVLDFTPDEDLPQALLRQILEFFESLRRLTPPSPGDEHGGPSEALAGFFRRVRSITRDRILDGWIGRGPTAEFLPVMPGKPDLFTQVGTLWKGPGPLEARILSPFYDEGPRAAALVNKLVEIMGVQGERQLEFHAPGARLPDGRLEMALPASLAKPAGTRREHAFRAVSEFEEVDGEKQARDLHAKALWLQREGRALFLIGSSNFTGAGTGALHGPSNIEANLAYLLPDVADAFAKKCLESWPPSVPVDIESETVSFLESLPGETASDAVSFPLPEGFGQALFKPEGAGGVLILALPAVAPRKFEIKNPEGDVLLNESGWTARGRQNPESILWPEPRPPSFLLVCWPGKEGENCEAVWPVNVTDTAALPPPDELRHLALEDLLEILTAARPLYLVLEEVLRRREKKAGLPGAAPKIDALSKVDTSRFLLRRMRRLAHALEGLRLRLERPAHSMEALRWRLTGPLGPLTLAGKLAAEEPEAAGFMIVEVALTVGRADWSKVNAELGKPRVQEEVQKVLNELRLMAQAHPAPPALQRYVKDAIVQVQP